MRPVLETSKVEANALKAIESFHSQTLKEVQEAVTKHKVVVVGMTQNPVVKKARGILADKKITYHYCEYGSYVKGWKPRLAIKLWSGWPTFPQIFINGQLIGGCAELIKWLEAHPNEL